MSVTTPGDSSVRLHRLTMVDDHDGVMVGRPDTGSYALFPAEGAQTLRLLSRGTALRDVAAWYEREYGSALDVEDFLATLEDLGFLLPEGQAEADTGPMRWQRLGRWTFSPFAWLCYLTLIAAAVVSMVHNPGLRPSYHNFFFTEHISLIPLVLTFAQIPCVLLHESFHALAGRRLGLPSTLGIGRRLYFLVAETKLDSLLSVPRRQRYLPFLAGMLADTVLISVLTLLSTVLRAQGTVAWIPAFCLALAFTCVLRLIWQLMFYLETDLYYVVATAMRCDDLQNATRFHIRAQFRRLLRRSPPQADADWSDRDRAMARWYAPLLVAGYGFSIASLLWAGLPTMLQLWSTVIDRFTGSQPPTTTALVDALIFVTLTAAQTGLLIYVTLRDRRAKRLTRDSAPEGALA